MLPFPVILIGLDDKLTTAVRNELVELSATVETEYEGVNAALTKLHPAPSAKKLLVVYLGCAEDAPGIRRLAETFSGWPILALVEIADDPDNVLRANRAGAMQVVPLPLLAGDLRAALAGISLYFRPPVRDCRVIAVTGSAPGCGATMIASNIAAEIACRFQRQTVLIELAQQMGILATNLDVEPPCTLADLLKDLDNLDGPLVEWALVRVADHFDLLAGSRGVNSEGSLPASGVLRVLDYVRRLARVVVLDVPCTYNDFQFEMLGAANDVVLVGEQSIASLGTLKSILAAQRTEPGTHHIHVVLNRYHQNVDGLTAHDAERTLQVHPIHTIPDDHAVVLASVNEGKVLRGVNPHSSVLAAVDSLVDALVESKSRPAPAGGSFFRRLFHAIQQQITRPAVHVDDRRNHQS